MRRLSIGLSTKMYFSHRQTLDWVREVAKIAADHPATTGGVVELFVIPTFPSIPGVVELARPAGIAVGAQDVAWEDAGAFTGEVSGAELAELGVTMAEIGHYERRTLFAETDEIVARKTLAALRNGLAPVLCVGEAGRGAPEEAAADCIRQLESALAPARATGTGGRLLLAYEPFWAIGAAEPAAAEHVTTVCRALRAPARRRAGARGAGDLRRQRRAGPAAEDRRRRRRHVPGQVRPRPAPCGASSTRSSSTGAGDVTLPVAHISRRAVTARSRRSGAWPVLDGTSHTRCAVDRPRSAGRR